MADTYCINCKENTEQTHFVDTGSEDYQECKKCGIVISHEFEIRYYHGLKEKEQYANAKVLEELEKIKENYLKSKIDVRLYSLLRIRIKELKEVKQP
jgi:hypothetical protein